MDAGRRESVSWAVVIPVTGPREATGNHGSAAFRLGSAMEAREPHNRLSILGPPGLLGREGNVVRSVLAQPKRIALLAYLRLARGGEAVSRDTVLGTFWPEVPEERALNALRQSLHFLRRSLGADVVERTGDHFLSISPEVLWCDVAAFEEEATRGRLEEALALYRGPFLDGVNVDGARALEEWVESARRRLLETARSCACTLARTALDDDRWDAAEEWASRAVELDPLGEAATSLHLEALQVISGPAAVLRTFERYAQRLREDLELEPSEALKSRVHALTSADQPGEARAEDGPDPEDVRGPRASHRATNPSPSRPPASTSPRIRRALVSSGWGFGVVLLVVALLWRFVPFGGEGETRGDVGGLRRGPVTADRPSVAVLPFVNLSSDTANAYFAAGVHESVLVNLSKIGALDVTALRAVRAYADSDLAPAEIAEELQVSSLMSGSVQREQDRIRITVELLEPTRGSQLWSETYDRRLDDVFSVQSDIARQVASSLRAVLTATEADRIQRRPTHSLEALDRYMLGRAAYGNPTLEGMNEAITHYRRAVEVDPGFAAAWAGIADAMLQRVQFFGFPSSWADSALALAEHAVELDPDLPEAHKTLGFVHSTHGRWAAAAEATEHALALRPAYAAALNNIGWGRYFLGDLAGAERYVRRSFRLDPTDLLSRSNVGAILAAVGRPMEGARWLDDVLAEEPGITATRTWRVFVDLDRGDPDGALERSLTYLVDERPAAPAYARAAFAALLARDVDRATEYARVAVEGAPGVDLFDMRRLETIIGYGLTAAGSPEEGRRSLERARAAVEDAVAAGADGWDPPWELAAVHAAFGDRDAALDHLSRAVDEGFPHPVLLRLDPTFDVIRGGPRFSELLAASEIRSARARAEGPDDPR